MARLWFVISIVFGLLSVLAACILAAAGHKDWALIPVSVGLISAFVFFYTFKYIEVDEPV